MMRVLGLSGGFDQVQQAIFKFDQDLMHDTAAVIVEDGQVIAGIEEERLNRIKHTNKIWSRSVTFCLQQANLDINDIDYIAVYISESCLNMALKHIHLTQRLTEELMDGRALYQFLFEREYGIKLPRERFQFVHHHFAHAATAYYLSGFSDGLILSIDGSGDDISTMVLDVKAGEFVILASKLMSDSIGYFYLDVIRFLGYQIFDEYKVMGLAPYGDAGVYRDLFNRFYSLQENGDYVIHKSCILDLYSVLSPRHSNEPLRQIHKNIAASLQEAVETIVFHILKHHKIASGHTRLCLTGGVAQNSSMNGKILQSGLFEAVFAPSFATDAGCAVGAALYVNHLEQADLPCQPIDHAYWGTPLPDQSDLESELEAWCQFMDISRLGTRSATVAQLIADGAVVGWVQGRSEFGPRALGHRSILADPRLESHKNTINTMIKKRENYRPFATSVLEEHVSEYFEWPINVKSLPFMSFVLPVKLAQRQALAAITHVDGSARLQTVSQTSNPRYWELINTFGEMTGCYLLLNTSFNNHAEPMVDSVRDAIVCYLTSGLDYLVVDDYLLKKKSWHPERLQTLMPSLPLAAELVQKRHYCQSSIHVNAEMVTTHQIIWNYDRSRAGEITPACYQLMQRADGTTTVSELMARLPLDADQTQAMLIDELFQLWSERMVCFSPN